MGTPDLRRALALGLLLLTGTVVRLAYLDVPPMDFHPTRQYRALLIARADSDAALAPLSAQQRANAVASARALGEIEPPLMERATSWMYDTLGREDLRVPRLLAIIGWLVGAAGTWMIAARAGGAPAGALAAALVLFLPYGIDASRAFMPDPWMVGLTMAALAAADAHRAAPSRRRGAARIALGAAAVLVKPMAAFLLLPAWLVLDVQRCGWRRGAATAVLAGVLCCLPAAGHYLLLIDAGSGVTERRFFVDLWLQLSFWDGWLAMLRRTVGLPLLVLAVLGTALAPRPMRAWLVAVWSGYIVLGLTFSHHISTHDYYSLPALPLAAVSASMLLPALAGAHPQSRRWHAALLGLAAVGVWLPSLSPALVYGDVDRARQTAAEYARIGEVTGYSPQVLALDGAYGYPLAYHAHVVVRQLPLSIDRALDARVGRPVGSNAALVRGQGGSHFVGTLWPEFESDQDLRAHLEQRRHLVARGGDPDRWRYVVFDLLTPASAVPARPAPASAAVSAPPFGFVDGPPAPLDPTQPLVRLVGWALDDRALERVDVFGVTPGGEVRLGQAARRGRRDDVAAAFPAAVGHERNAWSFDLLPEDFQRGLTDVVVKAIDAEGTTVEIGRRAVGRPPM